MKRSRWPGKKVIYGWMNERAKEKHAWGITTTDIDER